MEPINLKIGEKLKSLRTTRFMSLDDIAALTGVSKRSPFVFNFPVKSTLFKDSNTFFSSTILINRSFTYSELFVNPKNYTNPLPTYQSEMPTKEQHCSGQSS